MPTSLNLDKTQHRQYIIDIMDKLLALQYTNKTFKEKIFDSMMERYKNYLLINYSTLTFPKNRQYNVKVKQHAFSIKRYTSSSKDEILMNFRNMVSVRKEGVDYTGDSLIVCRELMKELKKHKKSNHTYYPYLNS